MTDDTPTRDDGQDAPSSAHSGLDEGHPAGDEPRDDRDVGGPTSPDEEDREFTDEGAPSKAPDSGFEPHE